MLFCDTTDTDISAHIVAVCRIADLDTVLAASMDEDEGVVDRVVVDDDTYMTYVTARMWTGEEYQIARLHLLTTDGDVAGILVT